MKNLFYRFAINLKQAYLHANTNVIKEGRAAFYGKVVLGFAGAALTLTIATAAYPWGSVAINIPNTVWICNQQISDLLVTADPDTGAINQTFPNVQCILFDDSGTVDMGHGIFQFNLSLARSNVTDISSSGLCTKQYSASCDPNLFPGPQEQLWTGNATQTSGDSFAECGNKPCVFQTSDPTATAKNANQVADLCTAAFPATAADSLGNSWNQWQTASYQTTNTGATCGTDAQARYCFTLPGVPCLEKVRGNSFFAHVSSAEATQFILTTIAVKDPFNPDSGTFQVDFLQPGIQITGSNPCDPNTAPKIGGVVPIRPSSGCTVANGNPRFFYDSQAVSAWIQAHGGVAPDGTATVTVTGTLTDGRHFIGFATPHIIH
jgi:hypothetical protein